MRKQIGNLPAVFVAFQGASPLNPGFFLLGTIFKQNLPFLFLEEASRLEHFWDPKA